ncbi:cold shock domain-containing protein E1-like [Physella acuta]|uniref:cold shock domain-containing protein E1-like n=1 Tax=Physella acuta TaxID=109671 RepID=UPI0027DC3667|nr:cold shock domain-containing protein E1-like [Physella acuta]
MSVKKPSPQWKKFQPPVQDPAIISIHQNPSVVNLNVNAELPQTAPGFPRVRETGLIDKKQHSYGFIQCCDRDARLFFHYSEYNGNVEALKIGEAVEFQMSYDRRTGKPVAVAVVKVDPSMVSPEIINDEKVQGTIVQEAKLIKQKNGTVPGTQDGLGRVTYVHNGECFFLPYGLDDVVANSTTPKAGEDVLFQIATDKRDGKIRARNVESLESATQRYVGVVCSMKDTFGFIERADIVKEIFFHYSEFKGDISELILGDDVSFGVQIRNNKEVAVEIECLPEGTVIFEDIAVEMVKGKILKMIKSTNRRPSEALAGRIMYETPKGLIEIPFGEKDQRGECTLQQGDTVEFQIATDRRDKLQRATNIALLDETFEYSGEIRETGVIAALKDGYGFIYCAERDARMFFHFSEFMDLTYSPRLQDELQFTVDQDASQPTRQVATRIRHLSKGSVSFINVLAGVYIGTIDKEPSTHKNQGKNKEGEPGNIIYDYEGVIQQIPYFFKDVTDQNNLPHFGDKVDFQIGELKSTGKKQAVKVRVVLRNIAGRCHGFVATLKENYGFIETADHEKEVFFHFSSFNGDTNELELGDEMEYTLARKSSKVSAENIRKLNKGTIPPDETVREKGTLQGRIIRPMRIVNTEQEEYCGLVQAMDDDGNDIDEPYPYGITSLADKRDFLQKDDVVRFQVARTKKDGSLRAINIGALRKFIRAKVDSVKGQYGFINFEAAEEGKKLFFHMTEVHDGAVIQPGDEVEFVLVQNQRNGKYSACSLRKITDTRRPERLLSRLKSITEDNSSYKVIIVRNPRGPDNTKGFQPRTPWKPAVS